MRDLEGIIYNDTWDNTIGQDNLLTTALIAGINGNKNWAAVNSVLGYQNVNRSNDTTITITLPAAPDYSINEDETVTVTIPHEALNKTSGKDITASPLLTIINGTGDYIPNITKDDITIYPNPFNKTLTISLKNLKNKAKRIKLYSSIGKCVKTVAPLDENPVTITTGSLAKGMFILIIEDENENEHYNKVIIKR